MGLPNEVISGMLSSGKDEDAYQVSRSLRFNSADSTNLNRTFSASPTDRKKMTISLWLKRTKLGVDVRFFGGFDGSSVNTNALGFFSDDKLYTLHGTGTVTNMLSTQVFRDTSAWYHFVFAYDMSNATSSNRVIVYVNGTQITAWDSTYYPDANLQFLLNNANNRIGSSSNGTDSFPDAYLAQIHCIDGQSLTPSSFAQSDSNGRWVPKAYTGTYGTNGFYLNFSDNSGITATTLGKDSSPNGNNWTPNNLSVTAGVGNDSLLDTPTNYGTDTGLGGEVRGNYCIMNPLSNAGLTLNNGNLDVTSSGSDYAEALGTIGVLTGKWYWEVTCTTLGMVVGVSNHSMGLTSSTLVNHPVNGYSTAASGSYAAGEVVPEGSFAGTIYTAITAGQVLGVAIDVDASKVWFSINGTWINSGNPATGTNAVLTALSIVGIPWYPSICRMSGAGAVSFNFGQRPFAYTAPTGFKSLNTQNLPTPAIKNPSKYMNIATYTGTGNTRSITGVGFQPDLVWTKSRSNIETHKLVDSIRGATKALSSETTGDEVTESGLTSFDSDGFTIDGTTDTGYNTNTYTYVGWNWKKGVTPGFDIVNYTGTGVARTISHSLGAVPHWMIIKARTTVSTDQGWPVYHRNNTTAPETDYLLLNSTAATADLDTIWNDTSPTSSVFSVGTNALVNTNNDTYLAYLWTEIAGFSRFGTYTGNAAADGPFVWCGFRPRWIMIKSSSAVDAWLIYDAARDTFNVSGTTLVTNTTAADATITGIDFLSNGFKLRTITTTPNAAQTYIFAAFSEAPFKYSRGR